MGRRVRRVCITGSLLTEMFIQGYEAAFRCVEGLPFGATLLGVEWQWDRAGGVLFLTFSHESFAELPEGSPIPQMDVVYRRTD